MTKQLGRRASVSTALAAAFGLSAATAVLAAPGEVPNLAWCPGAKTCLQWDAVAGATGYHVYRGERLSLPCLLNPAFDSCDEGTFAGTSTGSFLTEVPAANSVFWFLVTAVDGGGEGTCGLATAGPRDSEHDGACALSCAPAGAGCSVPADCCSGSCVAGTCQTSCCSANGTLCSQNGECCSGTCSGGSCHAAPCGDGVVGAGEQCDDGNNTSGDGCSATCTGEEGYYCLGSPSVCNLCTAGHRNCNLDEADGCEVDLATDPQNCGSCGLVCGGAPNAAGSCSGSVCGFACNSGFADCDGGAGNGCECTGNICCSGGCEPPHVNGLGQSFDDCAPLGVPGNEVTYSHTLAVEARAAWPFAGTDLDATCSGNVQAVYRQTATQCAVWVYTKTAAGHVHLNSANNTCFCATGSDPTWQ